MARSEGTASTSLTSITPDLLTSSLYLEISCPCSCMSRFALSTTVCCMEDISLPKLGQNRTKCCYLLYTGLISVMNVWKYVLYEVIASILILFQVLFESFFIQKNPRGRWSTFKLYFKMFTRHKTDTKM